LKPISDKNLKMGKYGLIGDPILHSKSPALFSAAYGLQLSADGRYAGIAGKDPTYELIEADTCKKALEKFRCGNFNGINVTSPFKEEVMKYVDVADRISSVLGSANILIKRDDGIYSFNSDYFGVKDTVSSPAVRGLGMENMAAGRPALVVGAGGAGKAAALALCDSGFETVIANRSSSHAAPFAEKIGASYMSLEDMGKNLSRFGLIIYALSFVIPQLENVRLNGKVLFEANYAHPHFRLSGASYISGKYWLLNQAVPAYKLFTGVDPDRDAMKRAIGL
jgi:shikimate dehydrogenase